MSIESGGYEGLLPGGIDIFISYANEERSRAQPLADALSRHGWKVWWDPTIPAGKRFRQVIDDALKTARSVVVLWTRQSVKSNWVIEEATEGDQRGILIPVLLEPVEPPLGLRGIQAADLTDWDGSKSSSAFQKLTTDLATLLGPPGKASRTKRPSKKRPRTEPGIVKAEDAG